MDRGQAFGSVGEANTTVAPDALGDPALARLQEQLADRDEIIVALQHVIRDLRHELENLRVEDAYAVFARSAPG